MADDARSRVRGVAHHPSLEAMLRFHRLSAEEKLRWLEQMRLFVVQFLPPERRAIMDRFRRGEI